MKKLLYLLTLLTPFLAFGQTSMTPQFKNNGHNPTDSIAVTWVGKTDGYSWINSNNQNRKDALYLDAKRFGLVNDGVRATHTGTLNTTALQNALDHATNKHLIIDGIYATGPLFITGHNIVIEFTPGSALIGTSALDVNDRLLTIGSGASNITINGYGSYIDSYVFGSGEQRHNININGASNITINGLTCLGGGGDGIYIGNTTSTLPTNIVLSNVNCDNSRRNGITVVNGVNIILDHPTCTNATGTLPKAGIDIEPNAGVSEQLKGIKVIAPYTSGNGGDGIHVAVGNLAFNSEKTLDITISDHTSYGDGTDGTYGGFNIVGNGYAYTWPYKLRGVISYVRGRVINPGGSGFYLNSMDPAFAPLSKVDIYVQDPGQTGSNNRDKSGALIYSGGGATYANGNLDLNIKTVDTRGTSGTFAAVYFYNTNQAITNTKVNIDFDNNSISGIGIFQSNGQTCKCSITSNQVYTYTISQSASVTINNSGATSVMSSGGTFTLPSYVGLDGQIWTIKNGSSGNTPCNVAPATGEGFPNVANSNPQATIALSLYNDQVSLMATNTGWQMISKQFKDRIIFTAGQARRDVFYATASPVDGTWLRGDIIYNSNATSGTPIGWECVTSGTPGTWMPFGFVRPGLAGAFTQGDFTASVSAGYRTYQNSGNITSNMTITLSGTGATEGNVMKFLRNDAGAGVITIVNGVTSSAIYSSFVGGSSVECQFSGGNWVLVDHTSQFLQSTTYAAANPTASVGVTAVNGSAVTYMRSDAAPKADTSLLRTVANSITLAALQTKFNLYTPISRTLTAGFGMNTIGDLSANRTISTDTTAVRSVLNSWTKAAADVRYIKLQTGTVTAQTGAISVTGSILGGSDVSTQTGAFSVGAYIAAPAYSSGTYKIAVINTTGSNHVETITGHLVIYTSDASTTNVSKSYLNTNYSTYLPGDVVYLPAANLKYIKMDTSSTGNWDEQPYNQTP